MSTLRFGQVLNGSCHNKAMDNLPLPCWNVICSFPFSRTPCGQWMQWQYSVQFSSVLNACPAALVLFSSSSFQMLLFSVPRRQISFKQKVLYLFLHSCAVWLCVCVPVCECVCVTGKLLMKLQFELTLYILVTDFYLISPAEATICMYVRATCYMRHATFNWAAMAPAVWRVQNVSLYMRHTA